MEYTRINLGTAQVELGVGSEAEHIRIEALLADEERAEIEELIEEGRERTVFSKFHGSSVLDEVISHALDLEEHKG